MPIVYTIYEIQTDADGNVAHLPPVDKQSENEAWAAYYLTLSYAVNSTVFLHTVMLCTNDGRKIDEQHYYHPVPVDGGDKE